MNQNGNGIVGGSLVTAGTAQGLVGWVAQNATVLSLAISAVTAIAGVYFLYQRNKQQHRLVKIRERELELKEQEALRDSIKSSSD